jgi:glucose/arabinose dehydrogenase
VLESGEWGLASGAVGPNQGMRTRRATAMQMHDLRLTLLSSLALTTSFGFGQTLTVERVATVGNFPTAIAATPDMPHQFYVATKIGWVWVVRGTTVLGTRALDLQAQVDDVGENGLLGLVLHPLFPSDPRIFACYTRAGGFGDTVVSEFTLAPGTLDVFDPASERVLVGPILQQEYEHKGGDLEFGPDGKLYVALGDGEDSNTAGVGVAQDLGSLRGKILRLDVDAPAPHVPLDNPFVQTPGAQPLVWAYGVRNPYRIAIDAVTGTLFVADVGASTYEEVTRIAPSNAGANLGWPCREGVMCTGHAACTCPSTTLLDPFIALYRGGGGAPICAVIGGELLRGSDIPRLEGKYVFSDFCSTSLWLVEDSYAAVGSWIDVVPEFDPAHQNVMAFVTEYARGPEGELLFASHYSGEIWRVRARPGFQGYCASTPNSSGVAATLQASGSPSIAAANIVFDVTGLPPTAFGYLLAARDRAHIPAFGGGQGIGCIGGHIYRWSLRVMQASASGGATLSTDLTDLPWGAAPNAGETWNFQYWTRDANPTATSNLSSAVAVTFAP